MCIVQAISVFAKTCINHNLLIILFLSEINYFPRVVSLFFQWKKLTNRTYRTIYFTYQKYVRTFYLMCYQSSRSTSLDSFELWVTSLELWIQVLMFLIIWINFRGWPQNYLTTPEAFWTSMLHCFRPDIFNFPEKFAQEPTRSCWRDVCGLYFWHLQCL